MVEKKKRTRAMRSCLSRRCRGFMAALKMATLVPLAVTGQELPEIGSDDEVGRL